MTKIKFCLLMLFFFTVLLNAQSNIVLTGTIKESESLSEVIDLLDNKLQAVIFRASFEGDSLFILCSEDTSFNSFTRISVNDDDLFIPIIVNSHSGVTPDKSLLLLRYIKFESNQEQTELRNFSVIAGSINRTLILFSGS